MPDRLQPNAFSDIRVHRQRYQKLEFQEISGLFGQAGIGKFFCSYVLGRHDVLQGSFVLAAGAYYTNVLRMNVQMGYYARVQALETESDY